MHIILWEYRVKPDRQSEFETIYAPNGPWAELFRNGTGYLGTELIQSDQTPARFITIDRWESEESYNQFLQHWRAAYERLDRQCEGLTTHEIRIGGFRQVYS